ncbi:MAG: hypothetical protein KDE51_17110, partial [Anaerolineales bacterium]|nr:hypothetical protein [Anaerolineales bacterium]
MGERFVRWAWVRFRPEEGWLSFVLLLSAMGIFLSAVMDANWVGPDAVVRVTGVVGFLVALYLVRRVRSAVWGWVLIFLSAIASTLLYLIQFSPLLLLTDRAMFWYEIKRGSLILTVNLLRWLLVLIRGGQGRGSAAFAVMLGLVAALVCAYLVWSAYRQRQPLRGLLLMGLLLGINNYFGGGTVLTTAMFMGVLVVATAALRFAHLQMYWQTNHIDYSEEIKPQLIFIALGLGAAFWLMLTIVPQVRPTEWARAFQELTAVRELEADLERLFGDVQTSGPAAAVQYPAASGVFPRSYLMGDPPDLAQIPVFTAEVYTTTERIVAGSPVALHWRGNSYDIYTGSGWNTSAEEEQMFSANEPLPVVELASETTITQTVQWQLNSPIVTFYMLGFPEQVNQASTFRSFNNSEFARLQSTTFRNEGIRNYTVVSRLTVSD